MAQVMAAANRADKIFRVFMVNAPFIFSYPGIGTLAYESARYKDYNLLMIISLMSGIIIIACNMAAQILNERIDPRMRISRQSEMQEVDNYE